MTDRSFFSDGAPCWADLSTPDLAGAHRFYGGLLGWTFDAPDPKLGNYASCRMDGKKVAGIMPFMPMSPPQQQKSSWSTHLQSSDLEATMRRITEAGGQIVFPGHDVMDLGRMMAATDPTGAFFGVWQPGTHRGAELFNVPGAMCWSEIYTRDGAAADRFYRAVFDHEQVPLANTRGLDCMIYKRDGEAVCGRVQMTEAWGDVAPQWRTYFGVADVDAAVAKLPALAGTLLVGPFEVPEGRIAMVTDPYGAPFALIERAPKSA